MHRGEIGGTVRPKGKVQRPVGKDTGSRQVTSDKSFGYPLEPFSSPRPESEAGPLVALDGDRVREASLSLQNLLSGRLWEPQARRRLSNPLQPPVKQVCAGD